LPLAAYELEEPPKHCIERLARARERTRAGGRASKPRVQDCVSEPVRPDVQARRIEMFNSGQTRLVPVAARAGLQHDVRLVFEHCPRDAAVGLGPEHQAPCALRTILAASAP